MIRNREKEIGEAREIKAWTGFDFPGIDLIAMLRPTMSPGLYAQMVGRGLRISPEKENCLVLDFAGNIEKHGIVTDIQPPHKRRKRQGIAPTKICPKCDELVHLSAKVCPECGYEFPQHDQTFRLSDFDISGGAVRHSMDVVSWTWKKAVSKKGNPMFIITYYPKNLAKMPITEYLVIAQWNKRLHELYPQRSKNPNYIEYIIATIDNKPVYGKKAPITTPQGTLMVDTTGLTEKEFFDFYNNIKNSY